MFHKISPKYVIGHERAPDTQFVNNGDVSKETFLIFTAVFLLWVHSLRLSNDKPKLCHFSLETAKRPKRHNLKKKIEMRIPVGFYVTLLKSRSKGFCLSSCHGASISHPVQRGPEPELLSHLPFYISLTLRHWKHDSAFSEN